MRSGDGFNSVITDAKELSDKIEVIADFEKQVQVHPKMVKRQFSYESYNQPIVNLDSKKSFNVNFF